MTRTETYSYRVELRGALCCADVHCVTIPGDTRRRHAIVSLDKNRGGNYGRSYQLSEAGLALPYHARVRTALAGAVLIVLTVAMLSAAWGAQGRGGRAGQGKGEVGRWELRRRDRKEWRGGEVGERRRGERQRKRKGRR